ncbi:Retrovirus-related Pol polyprotein from transposon TNT 1-94, partial [Stegodyphus mimosarum]
MGAHITPAYGILPGIWDYPGILPRNMGAHKHQGCHLYKPERSRFPLERHGVEPRRSERKTKGKPPERLGYLTNTIKIIPENFKDLDKLNSEEKEKWLLAVDEEINSLSRHKTWELVEHPVGKKPIGCRWIFNLKENEDGTVIRYKARLVAKGYSQKFGTDYDHTFAPVVRHTTIRTFLAVAAYGKMHVRYVDVTTAFLRGNLKEEIFMEQPEGTIQSGQEEKVCKLKKALYGLKQAARALNKRVGEVLKNSNFSQSTAGPCLFLKKDGNDTIMIIVYVDDILIACKSEEKIKRLIKYLNEFFEAKDLGEVRNYLGINIKRDENKFLLSQKSKIEKLKMMFCPDSHKPSYTPMDTSYPKEEDVSPSVDNTKYRSLGEVINDNKDVFVAISSARQKPQDVKGYTFKMCSYIVTLQLA